MNIDPTPPPAPAPAQFLPLDPRVIKLWRLNSSITSAVLLLMAGGGGGVLVAQFPAATLPVLVAWVLLAALRLWLWIFYPPLAFREWGYHLDGRVLEIRHGVWFKVVELLPLSRLQHVDLERGPLERAFGLASLVLHTAGTHNASIALPGLAEQDAHSLRDRLVAVGGDDAV